MKILITGASRGIGEALSREFGKERCHTLFLVARNKSALENLKTNIIAEYPGTEVHIIAVDLSDPDSASKVRKQVEKNTKYLDILINNAGSIVVKEFKEITAEEIDYVFNVNYKAPALLIASLIPFLEKTEKAHVVNIGSMAGFHGSRKFPGLSHYSASKAAIASLTECLAMEYQESICFNALSIGSVQTEMLAEAFPGFKAPLNPDEMAEFIVGFAKSGHHFINGKVLPVSLTTP